MKIEKPSLSEIRELYLNNKKYYEQISAYYSIHDPEFYETAFLKVERKVNLRRYFLRKRLMYATYGVIILLIILYYVLPIHMRLSYTDYEIRKNSFSITSFELSDFMIGMDSFGKKEYSFAKEHFLKVPASDRNYEEAQHMISLCDEEINEEALSESDDKPKNDSNQFPPKETR